MSNWVDIDIDDPKGLSPSQMKVMEYYLSNHCITVHQVRLHPKVKHMQIFYRSNHYGTFRMKDFGRRGGLLCTNICYADWTIERSNPTDNRSALTIGFRQVMGCELPLPKKKEKRTLWEMSQSKNVKNNQGG